MDIVAVRQMKVDKTLTGKGESLNKEVSKKKIFTGSMLLGVKTLKLSEIDF